jgi:hydroxymethylbilane synthase
MRLVLAARRSELARIQAIQVGEALQKTNPQITIEYSFHESLGDRNQNDPLWQMPEKGVFTQDLREGLLGGRYDLAVHSWKDLAIEDDPATEIAGTMSRADVRDVLLVRADRWADIDQTGSLTILTSSPRRAYNLDSFLRRAIPTKIRELNFVPVRGNVQTRIRKMWDPGADGLVVAKAAVDRLLEAERNEFTETRAFVQQAISQCRWMVLPLRANPGAPAQGALAIEIPRARKDLRTLLAHINSAETFNAVTREREILSTYGGGCHQKIGVSVLRRPYGEITSLRGLTDDGRVLDNYALEPSRVRPPKISRDRMWPLNAADADWFKREAIPATISEEFSALWISKADALPGDGCLSPSKIVWASGLKTWERLAKRGVWVNGCAESLGEQEHPRIETLAGSDLNWLKLTHADAFAENGMQLLATYRLVPKDVGPNLNDKKYFFWTSGSGFERALALNPWLREMTHFCGPGNTERMLEKRGVKPFVFLDREQWLKEMSLT